MTTKPTTASQLLHQHQAFLSDPASAPSKVKVQKVPWSAQQQKWVEKAWSFIDAEKAIDIDVNLVNIYSPTGYEKEVNNFVVDYWRNLGINANYQQMDAYQGNAIATIAGDGSGPTLLMNCPIDTHWTGDITEDGFQWGDPMRRDNTRPAVVEGQTIIGLGSLNDKGMATSIMMAVEALHRANVPLKGTLLAATLAGGAPALSPENEPRKNIGLCQGLIHSLTNGITGDYALFHKPGYHVSWEEPGMCYFRVRVIGDPDYMATESRADNPYATGNRAIAYRVLTDTARIIMELDAASAEYLKMAKAGSYRPAMAANALKTGSPNKPNWSPAISEISLDIRPAPWTAPMEVKYWFDGIMDRILKKYPDMKAEWNMYVAMPGGRTSPDSWIIQSAIRAAQAIEGDKSEEYEGQSAGQTEAGILRTWGIPTARISGAPPNPEMPADLQKGFTMSGAYAPHLVSAAKVLVHSAIDTLTRTREETGLQY